MRRSSILFLLLFLFLVPTGCSDDADPMEPQGGALDNVSLTTQTAASLGKVHLTGLPTGKKKATYVVHLLLDEAGPEVIQIDSDDEGPFFWAPLHPTQPNTGGTITVQVSDGANTGPEMTLDVTAEPADILVQTLGEVVSITATIENAETETLLWTAQQGSWQDGIGDDTNGPMTRPLKTPTSEGAYPFLVTVESTSTGGLRASGEPPRLDIVTVRYQAGEVIVTGDKECVQNGQTGTFSATVVGIEDQSVIWTLEDPDTGLPSTAGSINSAGVYSAPPTGSGTVMVVATSAVNSNIRGQITISYGGCICYYDLTITGEGNWVGDLVTHDFGQFSPVFLMTLGDLANSEEGSGMVQGFPGPGGGDTGTFDAGLTFIEGVTGWGTDEGTDGWATLTITENTTSVLVGSMTGTVVTVRGEEEVRRPFTLHFRSAQTNLGETPCQ